MYWPGFEPSLAGILGGQCDKFKKCAMWSNGAKDLDSIPLISLISDFLKFFVIFVLSLISLTK